MVVSAGAQGHLSGDERRASGGAARLAVVVGEDRALSGQAVDVRGLAHHAVRISADIPHADVIAPDDEDIGLWPVRCHPLTRSGALVMTCSGHTALKVHAPPLS
jgi:hypothetical protein